jgi:hypothetical protein
MNEIAQMSVLLSNSQVLYCQYYGKVLLKEFALAPKERLVAHRDCIRSIK